MNGSKIVDTEPDANGVAPVQIISELQRQLAALTTKVADLETQLRQRADPVAGPALALEGTAKPHASAGAAAAPPLSSAPQSPEPEQPPDVPMSAARVVMHELVLGHMGDAMAICYGGQVGA